MEVNILTKKFIDSEIKLIHVNNLHYYDILQICCTPIMSERGLCFICEARKKDE